MSRAFKISLILKSRNSLPVYKDLAKLSDVELDDQVRAIVRRMRANESGIIARMTLRQPTFSLNEPVVHLSVNAVENLCP